MSAKKHYVKFAVTFPKNHLLAGQPTYFPSKLNRTLFNLHEEGLINNYDSTNYDNWVSAMGKRNTPELINNSNYQKGHTIRFTDRFKEGDIIVPQVWTGLPYKKSIDDIPAVLTIGPEIKITKVYNINIRSREMFPLITFSEKERELFSGDIGLKKAIDLNIIHPLIILRSYNIIENDGLNSFSFNDWFKGVNANAQLIVWDERINYKTFL